MGLNPVVGELSGRRATVTGAGGFIGNAVCRRLVEDGVSVTGLDVNPAAAARVQESGAEFALADVTDPEALDAGLSGADLVVHTAAYVDEGGEMAEFVRVNVGGTINVLDAAERAGAERVAHISSVVVYGYDDPSEQDESAYRRACGVPYIDTKSASDAIACRRGAIVIRPGDVYGPGSIPWAVRPAQLARTGRLAVPGDGSGLMLPLFIDDLVDSVLLGLGRGKPGEAYTAWWDERPVTFEEYFSRIAEIVDGRPPRRLPRHLMTAIGGAMELAARLRAGSPPFTRSAVLFIDRRGTISTRRAREELGWQPRVGLEEGIRRTGEWLRAEGPA
jgi:nucleoside-diphosphate-sugar epimerase